MVMDGVQLNGGGGGRQERLLEFDFGGEDMPRLRVLVDQYAAWAGLAEPRRGDFVLAADAVATNAVEHGGGGGRLLLHRSGGSPAGSSVGSPVGSSVGSPAGSSVGSPAGSSVSSPVDYPAGSPWALECTISDSGPGFASSVIPDLAPGLAGSHCGRGLWLTRLITDRLVITAGGAAARGQSVRGEVSGCGSVVAFAMWLPG